MDLKELRAIKKRYIEKNEPNTIILNLNSWPKIEFIVIHSDKKAWATFYNEDYRDVFDCHFITFGRSNQRCVRPVVLDTHFYNLENIKNVKVLSNNPEVKRVYTEFIRTLIKRSYYHYYYAEREYELEKLFLINPLLYTEVTDGLRSSLKEPDYFPKVYNFFDENVDVNASTLKTACPGIPFKYFKIRFTEDITFTRIRELIALKYSPEDLITYKRSFLDYNTTLRNFWSNRQLVKYYAEISESSNVDWRTTYHYIDYLKLYLQLPKEVTKDFPLTPKIENIKKWHDRALTIYRHYEELLRQQSLKEKTETYLKEHYPKAKKFEYSNANYSIIACSDLAQLGTEGTMLHHCVGSYVNSVAQGGEYILFLRKNESIDTPFYTVDVTPEGKVRQIHGFGNCNVSEELQPFVNEWGKKFGLDISYCSGIYRALR